MWKITRYSACPSLAFVRDSVLELSVKMLHTNLESSVWRRHVGAHAEGQQHGGRKSMKTSGIHFCYKKRSVHPNEQVSIYIKTSRKTQLFRLLKITGWGMFFKHTWQPSGGHLDVVWRETLKFKMQYLEEGGCYRAKNLQQDIYYSRFQCYVHSTNLSTSVFWHRLSMVFRHAKQTRIEIHQSHASVRFMPLLWKWVTSSEGHASGLWLVDFAPCLFGVSKDDVGRCISNDIRYDSPGGGGGDSLEFLVGVCHPHLQFQTKKCHFPHPFSDLASKIHTRFQTRPCMAYASVLNVSQRNKDE